jgi:hypothetical protein
VNAATRGVYSRANDAMIVESLTRIVVACSEDDRFVICSMLHITSVEALQGTQ